MHDASWLAKLCSLVLADFFFEWHLVALPAMFSYEDIWTYESHGHILERKHSFEQISEGGYLKMRVFNRGSAAVV